MGPLPDTLLTFWRMAWDTGSNSFVMVTLVEEGGKVKCEPYWPQVEGETMNVGDMFSVTCVASTDVETHRYTELLCVKGSERRTMFHFWFTSWPDHGVPSKNGRPFPDDILTMLADINKLRDRTPGDPPPIIHCSAGVGRSGI
jgi:protein tyrosine phosphatase